MWFMEMKYGNNCLLGLYFSNRQEMFDWITLHFKYYTFHYNFTSLKIWYDKDMEE